MMSRCQPVDRDLTRFNHPDDLAAWKHIPPESFEHPTDEDRKQYVNLNCWIRRQFPNARNKSLEFIKRILTGHQSHRDVFARNFAWLTMCFGSFTRIRESCCLLEQVDKLLLSTVPMSNRLVSPFAGVMDGEEAQDLLGQPNVPAGSYLIRLSESLRDEGGFALAVKANAVDVEHYQIEGLPDQAMEEATHYNARLKLRHRTRQSLEERETPYPDIVDFMNERLQTPLQDNVSCTEIYPDLPFNDLLGQ